MKPLKPSMRENKRYLLVRGTNLKENVEKAILDFIGVFGMSKTGMVWIGGYETKNSAVISINRESVDSVRASLAVFKEKVEVEKVSGTLKGLGIKK